MSSTSLTRRGVDLGVYERVSTGELFRLIECVDGSLIWADPLFDEEEGEPEAAPFAVGAIVEHSRGGKQYTVTGTKNEGPGREPTIKVRDEAGNVHHFRPGLLKLVQASAAPDLSHLPPPPEPEGF